MIINKRKIINDPVHGFITIPYDILYDLIEEPCFQRLRRIKQLGLTHYVYPGALHTRFHHALGAMHLMTEAIHVLQSKGVEITEAEAKAATIAILLHDIGHGPFSHALENILIDVHHEELSLGYMEILNKKYDGKLSLAIKMFKGEYKKKFLYQLISSQLDMDRLDYLTRDSFYSGVLEGSVGYDRIIKMLNVHNDNLVVEEKGIYSVENLLIARRFMYLQVYLHKTVISAEQMLVKIFLRAKELINLGTEFNISSPLFWLLSGKYKDSSVDLIYSEFSRIDDNDIICALKEFKLCEDLILRYLSSTLLNRKLLKVVFMSESKETNDEESNIQFFTKQGASKSALKNYLFFKGVESTKNYELENEILILSKQEEVSKLSSFGSVFITTKAITKIFYCSPKSIYVKY